MQGALKIGTNRLGPDTVEMYVELFGKSVSITPQEARFIARDLEGLAERAEANSKVASSVERPVSA